MADEMDLVIYDPNQKDSELYQADEYEWINAQIAILKRGQLDLLDRDHLIEYLSDMASRDRREMKSRLTVLLIHLLKMREQPEMLTPSWVRTVLQQQQEIRDIVEEMPSLGRMAPEIAKAAYANAVRSATRETRLPASRFPAQSPWTVAEALAFDPPEPPARPKSRR